MKAGVPQARVLGPFLYLLFTNDFSTRQTTTATFADEVASVLAFDENPKTASMKLQQLLNLIEEWAKNLKIKNKPPKPNHITCTSGK